MSHYFEFSGYNLEDAINTAMNELQVSRKEIRYKIMPTEDEDVLIRVYIGSPEFEGKNTSKYGHPKDKNKRSYKSKKSYQDNMFSADTVFLGLEVIENEDVVIQDILRFIQQILDSLNITLEGFFVEDRENEKYINLKVDQSALIIGKQGSVLNALQFVVGAYIPKIFIAHNLDISNKKTYTIDIQGYRSKRISTLQFLVNQAADTVRLTGEAILLEGEFSPIERRQIHIFAQSLPGIETESQGDKFFKTVLIKAIQ